MWSTSIKKNPIRARGSNFECKGLVFVCTQNAPVSPQRSENRARSKIESGADARANSGFDFSDDCLSWGPSRFKRVQVPGGPQLSKCNPDSTVSAYWTSSV